MLHRARSHGLLVLSAVAILLAGAGCAATQNTLAQDLAFEQWEKCKQYPVNLQRITPEGQIWVTYTADHRMAFNAWNECIQKARAEQGRTRTGTAAMPPAPSGQVVAPHDMATPVWKIGDEWAYRYDQPSGSGTFVWSVDRIEALGSEPHYVIKTGTREILYRVSDLAFTQERVGGEVVRQVTPSDWRFVAFPLSVGRSWNMKYHETRPVERQTEDIERACQAEAEESVSVPAGTFRTIRIVCKNMRNGAWVLTVWYSPDIRHMVREESAVIGGRRMRELLAYKVR